MRGESAMREAVSPYLQLLISIVSCSRICVAISTNSDAELLNKIHPCNHDEVAEENPRIINLASQGERLNKRQLGYSNIRIHPILAGSSSNASIFVQGNDSPLSKAINTLQSLLLVHPVRGNLIIPPECREYRYGSNEGKCRSPLPSQSDFECGEFGVIPLSYIGTREVCSSRRGLCRVKGPDGPGLPNADYLLFVSVSYSFHCSFGTLAYASHCILDKSDNNRPVAGYVNICPNALDKYSEQPDILYGLFMHEIIHALGFSSRLFDKFVDSNGNNYNATETIFGPHGLTHVFTGPKTMEIAKQYYACEDIEGVYLENEGGLGTTSSHWEKRTLQHEVMNGYISNDYLVLSEFTLALLEDSGWYQVNYAALNNLKQLPLQWGKGLGCPFLTEPCTNQSAFPYLCDASDTQLHCTYDHLTKGNCSAEWLGFDNCPVALAYEIENYCRAKATLGPFQYIENYSDSSICVDGINSDDCITQEISFCVAQETYMVNGSNQYALQLENEKYECQDGYALITENNIAVLCPPHDEVILRSPAILNNIPSLSPSTTFVAVDLDALKSIIQSNKSIVAFGDLTNLNNMEIWFNVNSIQKNGTTFICQLFGCTTCATPLSVDNGTIILSADAIYSVLRGMVVASVTFVDLLTQSRDYAIVLMLDPQADHSFVYYAVSIDFLGSYLKELHSNDDYIIRVISLANNTEIRIAPSKDVKIDGFYTFHREEIVFILDIGETLMISSYEDLTGSRVTANKSILFYSGHYCTSGKSTNCSILNEQIPPYNSWGNTFVLHTNISGLRGNMLKVVASDIGANVFMNCTTDGADYEVNNFYLEFRQHIVLSVSHDYCTVKSDENILILQFRDSSPPLMDTFMTIIPALVHFEDSYTVNAHEGFDNYMAVTVKNTYVTNNSIMFDDSPIMLKWKIYELDGDTYYFGTLSLTAGRHKVTFIENSITFGAILYGSNENNSFALPGGMKLNVSQNFTHAAPESVQNPLVVLVGNIINVTWSPPSTSNGKIVQYIVQRRNSSGKFYHHVSGNTNYLELSFYNDALVFIAAVNQYGQSSFEVAKSSVPCMPSPCINNGTCVIMNANDQHCDCDNLSYGQFCESTQKLYPFGITHNDILLPSSHNESSSIILSDIFTFYNRRTTSIYVNTNGIVSFDAPFNSSYIRSLPLGVTERIIAPYWSSIDTRGTGKIFYRETAEPNLLTRASSEIQAVFPTFQNFTIKNLFIATWDAVGYYPKRTDKTNTFQCILARSQYESFVMFLYADIQWTSFSAGALVGIDAGDGINHVTVPGSQTSNILNIEETSNTGTPGVWMFKTGEDNICKVTKIVGKFSKDRSKVILTFSAGHPDAIYECKIDKKRFKTCTSPLTVKKSVNDVTVRAYCLVDGKLKLQKRKKFKNKL